MQSKTREQENQGRMLECRLLGLALRDAGVVGESVKEMPDPYPSTQLSSSPTQLHDSVILDSGKRHAGGAEATHCHRAPCLCRVLPIP